VTGGTKDVVLPNWGGKKSGIPEKKTLMTFGGSRGLKLKTSGLGKNQKKKVGELLKGHYALVTSQSNQVNKTSRALSRID